MRITLTFLGVLLALSIAGANSYLVTLPEKLSYCCFIAHVKVKNVTPNDSSPTEVALLRAEVIEVFKGSDQREVLFSSHAYAHLAPGKLPDLVGKDFIIFLHDPYENGKLYLFEGPKGMLPMAEEYTEYMDRRLDPEHEPTSVSYSREQYLKMLRNWKLHVGTDKTKPNNSRQKDAGASPVPNLRQSPGASAL